MGSESRGFGDNGFRWRHGRLPAVAADPQQRDRSWPRARRHGRAGRHAAADPFNSILSIRVDSEPTLS
ncbi:hypothetical protein BZL29_0769 [Mycobacterium kansasii]|uniref:Uncharacterized protein n=1 Tax=Mycobacterium kansasii TaxID=1768 RepID=A0A1V3XX40_MYCKA|nr:hypothetical protein BZL29_0769 [Mycobacterium kansasii]